jgi:hypothetical protein
MSKENGRLSKKKSSVEKSEYTCVRNFERASVLAMLTVQTVLLIVVSISLVVSIVIGAIQDRPEVTDIWEYDI